MIIIEVKDSNQGVEISESGMNRLEDPPLLSLNVKDDTDKERLKFIKISFEELLNNKVIKNKKEWKYLFLYAELLEFHTPCWWDSKYIYEGLKKFVEERL